MTWTEPEHDHPCTATLTGRILGGGTVQCTREARHPGNHVGPKRGPNGRALWDDGTDGATRHQETP